MCKEHACAMTGIAKSTLYKWCQEGEEHARMELDTLQRQLYEGIPVADAHSVYEQVKNITKAAKKDWRASAWFLERRYPAQYARRDPPPPERERAKIMLIG